MLGRIEKHGMQGIEADDGGAEIGCNVDKAPEITEVAYAPVRPRAEEVKLERDAPDRPVLRQAVRDMATCGDDDQRHLGRLELVSLDPKPVVADRRWRLDDEAAALDGSTVELARAQQLEFGEGLLAFPGRAFFLSD